MRKNLYLGDPLEKNDQIGLGIIGALTVLLFMRKKGSEDPVMSRTQMIDEIMYRCEQQTEGCDAQRPTLEQMSDDQLRLILEEMRKLAGAG